MGFTKEIELESDPGITIRVRGGIIKWFWGYTGAIISLYILGITLMITRPDGYILAIPVLGYLSYSYGTFSINFIRIYMLAKHSLHNFGISLILYTPSEMTSLDEIMIDDLKINLIKRGRAKFEQYGNREFQVYQLKKWKWNTLDLSTDHNICINGNDYSFNFDNIKKKGKLDVIPEKIYINYGE